MSSQRSSSPISEGGSPAPLTPRSKIKALLATVESSDEEETPTKKTTETTPSGPLRLQTQPNKPLGLSDHDDDDEPEEDIRPRGRLASRMQGLVQPTEPTKQQHQETARERVKKMLERENQEAEQTADVDMANAEEEDELPVAPRRLHRRKHRQSGSADGEKTPMPSSPGLFVSSPVRPSPAKSTQANTESEDDGLPSLKSNRFQALVERKRQERLAREAADEARQAERRAQQEKLASEMEELGSDEGNLSGITDDEGGRRLSQKNRPARKASKKAIEEMNRETQRMARSMQLAHEAKTRNKISKNSLFERFNYRPAGELGTKMPSSSRPASPHSDVEMRDADTPPSSPPTAKDQDAIETNDEAQVQLDEELPPLDELTVTAPRLDKGKGKAVDTASPESKKTISKPKRQVRVKLPVLSVNRVSLDSDDELEVITTTKDKINAVFDNIPTTSSQQSHSLQALRALAQVRSPGKDARRKTENHGMTVGELQAFLQQKARHQAKLERDCRLEMLKSQGIVVQTAAERERQMQEVEDLVAKAREEAQKIMQEEHAAAKKERKENGEADPLAWDDSDDDDDEYEDPANEADAEVELSGSEDEEENGEDEENEGDEDMEGDETADNAILEEAKEAESELSEDADEDDDDQELPVMGRKRPRKQRAVLSDDEDAVESTPRPKTATHTSPTAPKTVSPAAPTSVLRSAKKTFIPGLPVQGPAGLGLTQIFAGTMDDSQPESPSGPTQSMMPDFDNFPDSNFSATMDERMEDMIVDSQQDETQTKTQGIKLDFSQSQMRGLGSLLRDESNTQLSDIIELSQDGGFQAQTPLKERFIEPHSTVETVMAEQHDMPGHDSPLVRRGRLRRRMEASQVIEETPEPMSARQPETVFNVMKDAAQDERKRKLAQAFDHKKSKAKQMVEEQAEESEDEYAGLGGADGEDSDNESAASVKEMIDDAAGNDLDEAKLAAFYNDRERANDEKQVEKLFKDITTGMLRRKRGADYDLSDSDDGGEARRRMKRRQFSKMQKALFADERVKKIAENPGNQAFLRTIEDRGSDDEMDILGAPEEPAEESSQSQSQSQSQGDSHRNEGRTIPDSQPRKHLSSATENRAPAQIRRMKDGKKPTNIGEVRQTLVDLLGEPHDPVVSATEAGSDGEEEEHSSPTRSDKENAAPNPRRGRVAVVDRISLKRNTSSTLSTSSNTRLAFAASSSSSFKVPALLRRATTNSVKSGSTASSSGASQPTTGGFGEESKIKRTAGKKSGINAFARDSERQAIMQKSEQRREERKIKGAASRLGAVRELFGKGTFE